VSPVVATALKPLMVARLSTIASESDRATDSASVSLPPVWNDETSTTGEPSRPAGAREVSDSRFVLTSARTTPAATVKASNHRPASARRCGRPGSAATGRSPV
jgi:hypothetical protein